MIALEVGSRPWEPIHPAEDLRVLNRFNGAPTLGFFTANGERYLFWQAQGYITDSYSLWAYAPVTESDEQDSARMPYGVLFDSPVRRTGVAALALGNRLVFAHAWDVRADSDVGAILHGLIDCLMIALTEESSPLPTGERAHQLDAARQAVELLAHAA